MRPTTKNYEITLTNFGPTKYLQEKIVDPRNTHEKNLYTHEIFRRNNLGRTRYPRKEILDSRNSHEKKISTHEIPTKARWHNGTRLTRPAVTRDPRNLTHTNLWKHIKCWMGS